MKESEQSMVDLSDDDPSTVRAVVEYMYTQNYDPLESTHIKPADQQTYSDVERATETGDESSVRYRFYAVGFDSEEAVRSFVPDQYKSSIVSISSFGRDNNTHVISFENKTDIDEYDLQDNLAVAIEYNSISSQKSPSPCRHIFDQKGEQCIDSMK